MVKKITPQKKQPPPKPSRATIIRRLARQGKAWVLLSEVLKKKF